MPLPTPRKGEKQDEFISRCMSDETAKREFPNNKQRQAVCFSQWRRKHGGKKPGSTAVYHAFFGTVWAITDAKMHDITAFLELRAAGGRLFPSEIEAAISGRQDQPSAHIEGSVAVLPLLGVISQRMDLLTQASGGTSTERFAADFDQLMGDDDVGAIVLDVDSPGGSVYGIEELSSRIHAGHGRKPVVAVANAQMASAAYWIASAAGEIVVTPSGEVGSIGTLAVHTERSGADEKEGVKHTLLKAGKFKGEASGVEPLSDEARVNLQARVDDYYNAFVGSVAKNRSVTKSEVQAGYGEGRLVGASEAVEIGLADRIDTLEGTIKRLAGRQRMAERRRVLDQRAWEPDGSRECAR